MGFTKLMDVLSNHWWAIFTFQTVGILLVQTSLDYLNRLYEKETGYESHQIRAMKYMGVAVAGGLYLPYLLLRGVELPQILMVMHFFCLQIIALAVLLDRIVFYCERPWLVRQWFDPTGRQKIWLLRIIATLFFCSVVGVFVLLLNLSKE